MGLRDFLVHRQTLLQVFLFTAMQVHRARLLPKFLVAVAVVLLGSWAASAFVPSAATQSHSTNPHNEFLLRGSAAPVAAVTAAVPLAASAEDALIDYNMRGEFTESFIYGYFGLTTIFTIIAFTSYLVLTKLKII